MLFTGFCQHFRLQHRKRDLQENSATKFWILQNWGGTLARGGGLLLRHAVDCAEAPDQVSAVDRHDVAVWENVGKGVEGDAIIGIVENGYQHQPVRNVE